MKYLPGFLIRFLPYFFGVFLSIPSSIPLKASFRFPLTFFLSFEQFFQGLLFKNHPGFLNPERFLLEQFMGIQQLEDSLGVPVEWFSSSFSRDVF